MNWSAKDAIFRRLSAENLTRGVGSRLAVRAFWQKLEWINEVTLHASQQHEPKRGVHRRSALSRIGGGYCARGVGSASGGGFCSAAMNVIQTWIQVALAAALVSGCASGRLAEQAVTVPVPHGRNGEPVFHDEQIKDELARAGVKFVQTGEAPQMNVLQSQLKRTHCALALPKQRGRKLSVEEINKRGCDGVVVIGSLYQCGECNFWHLLTNTGFILTESGAIVTCYHVVNKPTHKVFLVMTSDGHIYPVKEVLAANESTDVAILRIEGSHLKPVSLSTQARVGSRVFVIGHPEQHFYSFTEGIVSRYFTGQKETGDATMMSITADFAPGSSGCPVFNEFGSVVGMADNIVSTVLDEDATPARPAIVFKHCRPAEAILNLIQPGHSADEWAPIVSSNDQLRHSR